jgi:hypothetical protein
MAALPLTIKALSVASSYGVPIVMDAQDICYNPEEHSMMTYISYYRDKLVGKSPISGIAEKKTTANGTEVAPSDGVEAHVEHDTAKRQLRERQPVTIPPTSSDTGVTTATPPAAAAIVDTSTPPSVSTSVTSKETSVEGSASSEATKQHEDDEAKLARLAIVLEEERKVTYQLH